LQRGPEIADVTPDTPALQLGPAKIRLIGYPQLTTVWRSTNSGGGVGTTFANIPFNNTIPGNTSEFRISSQSTRLAIRADADLKSTKAAGYFEMDFGGSPNSGTVAVTSSSYTHGASRVASVLLFLYACCRPYPGGTAKCVSRSLPLQ
jgi:hypothetical protein